MTPSNTPPLPPTTEDDLFHRLRLLRSRRVGPATFHRLLAEHGSPQAALDALPGVARAAGVTDYAICSESAVHAELDTARRAGATLLSISHSDYPLALRQLDTPPPLLWTLGQRKMLTQPMVALVGARNASSLGTRMAKSLAAGLSEAGYVVVSGLARGIDTSAHLASLRNGTIAVMAGGVDVIYPVENAGLAQDIREQGLRISEMPMGMPPQARHFPARNRIISGLARAVVVVEAAAKSGSLITAREALDQSRDVLAVPGHPFDARAAGCNLLLRDGATLVRTVQDVLDALGPITQPAIQADLGLPPVTKKRPLKEIAALHAQILDKLGPVPLAEDQLIRDLAVTPHDVSPALTDLELAGKIVRGPGGTLARPN